MPRIYETSISEQLMPPEYVLTPPQASDAPELNRIRVRSWWETSVVQGGVPGVNREWLMRGMATYTSPEQDRVTTDRIAVARRELATPGTDTMILVARFALDAAGEARVSIEEVMGRPPVGYIAVDKWFDPEGQGRPLRQELSTLQTGVTGSGLGPAMMAAVDEAGFWYDSEDLPVDVGAIAGTYSNEYYQRHGFRPYPEENYRWTNGGPQEVLSDALPMLRYKRFMSQKAALAHWGLVLATRKEKVSV